MDQDINKKNSETEDAVKAEKSSFIVNCYEWMEALIPALIIIVTIFVVMFRIITVNGDSMLPNLKNGYKVLLSCIDRNFSSGDIVVIDKQGIKLNQVIIKRVIATEGQIVDINSSGMVSVNGVEIDESDYIENGITKSDGYDLEFPQTVPDGHVFVLGDNRKISDDSRSSDVGMVDERYIIGKFQFVLMPIEK